MLPAAAAKCALSRRDELFTCAWKTSGNIIAEKRLALA
jgi:hypothetical protein